MKRVGLTGKVFIPIHLETRETPARIFRAFQTSGNAHLARIALIFLPQVNLDFVFFPGATDDAPLAISWFKRSPLSSY